jgi:hypothetical protein
MRKNDQKVVTNRGDVFFSSLVLALRVTNKLYGKAKLTQKIQLRTIASDCCRVGQDYPSGFVQQTSIVRNILSQMRKLNI